MIYTRDSKIKIKNINLITPKYKSEHPKYEYKKYEINNIPSSSCYVAIYEIPPQKSNYPYHYHEKNEEVFYIISGEGIIETPEGNKNIKQGDVIVCPPSPESAHKLFNISKSENLIYVEFDTVNFPDITYYPHTNKVGIINSNNNNLFFKQNTSTDYYDNE